jgi:gas vesicle protein
MIMIVHIKFSFDNLMSGLSLSKENLNIIKSKISKYNSLKSKIDNLYKSDNDDIESELSKIVGDGDDKNEFLLSYANILSFKNKIEKITNSITDKKLELSEYKDRLAISTGSTKDDVSNKIKKLEDDIRLMTDDLNKKMKDLPVIEKKHTDEMNTVENNIKKWISSVE